MQKYSVLIATAALLLVTVIGLAGCDAADTASSTTNTKPITVVWYPNESANDYEGSRNEFGRLIEEATGRKVEHKLTTDYTIAIESLASGAADIGAVMGAVGYIEAKNKNSRVDVLFVNSGVSGTLDDAIYYSWLCVNVGDADKYKEGDGYSITNVAGKRMSFVSNSSTSGFKVPTASIIDHFKKTPQWANLSVDDLVEGGSKAFFSQVLFGGSHQGSAFNLLSGKADVAAFCDTEVDIYTDLKEGEENKVGSVYNVKNDATAPFNTVRGKEFVIIASTPVLNGPNAYNPQNLSAEEIKKIRDIFTSEATANNEHFFYNPDSGNVGFYKKTNNECYLQVNDSWFNPIREMN
ncbi:MAG: PhnD/SsuA/transferrin family substrate-binding protein [Peptococcaceae bacterium]|nr:PhnD/SsuA/transferrin family substrate-binding protein [Peptococcaceae bacterium]